MNILFISNGHGEEAIATCIARALCALDKVHIDHLALVGDVPPDPAMHPVGPRRRMPSGGLIAMANLRNLISDVRAGLIGHTLRQYAFLAEVRSKYAVVVAVGDIFVLLMALRTRRPTVYVGTAKSVYVASYGFFERWILKRATRVYVRDDPTAEFLQERGIPARAPGNVIVDLFASDPPSRVAPVDRDVLALFPGSRTSAYSDAVFLARVVRSVVENGREVLGILSVARTLDAATFERALRADGWHTQPAPDLEVPFEAVLHDHVVLRASLAPLNALLAQATLVLGQAGTANEAAAAAGVPIIAFEGSASRKNGWYRMRQARLLGDALHILPRALPQATWSVVELLSDSGRRKRMGEIGRQRMGGPGGALAIARDILALGVNERA